MKKKRLLFLRGLAVLALAAVLLLDAGFVLLPDRAFSPVENRNLQQRPAVTLRGITSGRFESRFESYVNDQFPLRDRWVALKAALDRLMGRTESNGVFLARHGYLIQDFSMPAESEYAANLAALRTFSERHPELPQYLLAVPTALSVYAGELPAFAPAGDEDGYLDRLQRDLASAPLQFVDLRPDFAEAGEGPLYYRTDHHWTSDAARIAYLRLSEVAGLAGETGRFERRLLSNRFCGTLTAMSGFRTGERDDLYAYLPREGEVRCVVQYVDEGRKSSSFYQLEYLDQRDQYAVFFGGNHPEIRIETAVDNERTLLVLKDSYANCFVPFLAQDYRRIVVVDPRYFTGDLEQLMETERISEVLFLYNAATLAADTLLRQDLVRQ